MHPPPPPSGRLAAIKKLLPLLAPLSGEDGTLDGGDEPTFRFAAGSSQHRLFGGLVAAQTVVAAAQTVEPGRRFHSLHGSFLRAGQWERETTVVVEPLRQGRSFATRAASARQDGTEIFRADLSFVFEEPGIEHESPPPKAAPPEQCADRETERIQQFGAHWLEHPINAIEVRVTEARMIDLDHPSEPHQQTWFRFPTRLPDDPILHSALLVFASDRGLLSTAALPHGLGWGRRLSASLDHAVWQHRDARVDDWLLYDTYSPIAVAGRGWIQGAMYTAAGSRVATTAQEALIRG